MKFRWCDAAVFLLAAGVTVVCSAQVYGNRNSRLQLCIRGMNGSWVYPINRTERLEISGPLGITVVELSDGKARVLSSPCTGRTCIASGTIHKQGQWIACLPNGVSLAVEGRGDADIDAAAW